MRPARSSWSGARTPDDSPRSAGLGDFPRPRCGLPRMASRSATRTVVGTMNATITKAGPGKPYGDDGSRTPPHGEAVLPSPRMATQTIERAVQRPAAGLDALFQGRYLSVTSFK